ncbi:hypothetical protein GW17_00061020, partial [Ensete ventricosum]
MTLGLASLAHRLKKPDPISGASDPTQGLMCSFPSRMGGSFFYVAGILQTKGKATLLHILQYYSLLHLFVRQPPPKLKDLHTLVSNRASFEIHTIPSCARRTFTGTNLLRSADIARWNHVLPSERVREKQGRTFRASSRPG